MEGVTSHLFYLFHLVSTLLFVNLPQKFIPSGVTPWRVSPGAVYILPSDATEEHLKTIAINASTCVLLIILQILFYLKNKLTIKLTAMISCSVFNLGLRNDVR